VPLEWVVDVLYQQGGRSGQGGSRGDEWCIATAVSYDEATGRVAVMGEDPPFEVGRRKRGKPLNEGVRGAGS
jgi:hypothetical protein